MNAAAQLPSDQLGNYRLVRLLGRGGFAAVYLGEHLYLKRLAAIKVLQRVLGEKEQAHFLEEARLLANLSHPHIVGVLEFAMAQRCIVIQNRQIVENIPFLVMDYAPAGSLRTLYPVGVRLPLDVVVKNVKQVASALQYAHDQNIVHRDVKPENLLMNERQEIMLSDFGLALFSPPLGFLSLQGIAGTFAYSAPEQLRGKPEFASDQYSLAIVAYEWLCGYLPFTGSNLEVVMHHVSSPPPRLSVENSAIPLPVEDVILKALAKDPQQRYQDVQSFAQALELASLMRSSYPNLKHLARIKMINLPVKRNLPDFHYFAQKGEAISPILLAPTPTRAVSKESRRNTNLTSSMERNRLGMIRKVRAFWVRGVLEKSMHGASFIPLGLEEKQDAVANLWSPAIQQEGKLTRSLPSSTRITEIYDQLGGELLILGEAGSGKTTLLLELASSLLDRAEQDEAAPIPVVFSLASWAETQQPLETWLVGELNNKYQVPRPLGEYWVRHEMLLPLLDGLDEVGSNARSACIMAINAYKKERGLNPLVVCSRLTEYLLFPPRILLQSAVVVRPLTLSQIEDYLCSAGEKFNIVFQMLHADLLLQRLVTTPLMLKIITQAYRDASPDELLAMCSSTARYQIILSAYVEQMFHRHPSSLSSQPSQLISWLAQLASRMQNFQRVFYIEHLQPYWIKDHKWVQFYNYLAVILPGVLIGAFTGILSNVLFFHAGSIGVIAIDAVYGMVMGYLFSGRSMPLLSVVVPVRTSGEPKKSLLQKAFSTVLIVGLITFFCMGSAKGWLAGLANALFLGILSIPVRIVVDRSVSESDTKGGRRKDSLLSHFRGGLLAGIICGLTSIITLLVNHDSSATSISFLLILGVRDSLRNVLLGTAISLMLRNNNGFIRPAEIISWSWKRFWRSFKGLKFIVHDLLLSFAIGLSFGSKQLFQGNEGGALSAGLSTALLSVLATRLFFALMQGLSNNNLTDDHRFKPNEGIKRSMYHGCVGGMISIFFVSFFSIMTCLLASVTSNGLASLLVGSIWLANLKLGLSNLLLLAPCAAMLAWLLMGGLAVLQHYCLRFILWRTGAFPLKITRFLEYAADCVLLYRVGGGYMFISRLLLEHFASLAGTDGEPKSDSIF